MTLRIDLLGGFRVTVDGRVVAPKGMVAAESCRASSCSRWLPGISSALALYEKASHSFWADRTAAQLSAVRVAN